MLKIVSCMFSLLLVGSVAVAGAPTLSSPVPNASGTIPQVCSDQKFFCTLECGDLSGSARAACLRICNKEYQDCIAGHQTLTAEDEAISPEGPADAGFAASTSPQICFDHLQACVLSCDNDDGTTDLGCTRQCVREYHQCLGH